MKNIVSQFQKALIYCVLALFLTSCSDEINYAPVADINTIDPIPQSGIHQVTKSETLYEIAWRYGLDYRYLVERNRLKPPYKIQVGQKILLQGGNSTIISLTEPEVNLTKPQHKPTPVQTQTHTILIPSQVKPAPAMSSSLLAVAWTWPAKGKIINSFSSLHKGINIAGIKGEPVYATASGKVVYCGNGLRGYGNLIILKHNSFYLSAYAHNHQVLVKEGDTVKQGQQIAEMGDTGTDRVMLHFEIRHAGKPVDPISLLNG